MRRNAALAGEGMEMLSGETRKADKLHVPKDEEGIPRKPWDTAFHELWRARVSLAGSRTFYITSAIYIHSCASCTYSVSPTAIMIFIVSVTLSHLEAHDCVCAPSHDALIGAVLSYAV